MSQATKTAEVEKNSQEVLRVRHTRYEGRDLLDVRAWLKPLTPDGEHKPTRKGLTLRPETWRQLVPLIQDALES